MSLQLPPLALYIHIPWCIQKCPYCDFNSHAVKQGIPEQEYIAHLLNDLDEDLHLVRQRPLHSIFIGGGTPSVFSADGIKQILDGVLSRMPAQPELEVTMEANPGTFEAERFAGYVAAGVTRFSIGVQTFQAAQLSALGRIHNADEACRAAKLAATLPLKSYNLDLMHGLPGQTVAAALDDLAQAIALQPPHLSWYQLTIEPNTAFASKPPTLPDDDILWDIQQQGLALLSAAGYQQYETSAYSKTGHQCQHNLNYWRYGDYLGIGCGAHGKITLPSRNSILRTVKVKHPKGYMDLSRSYLDERQQVEPEDRPFEFFMNRFRLLEPCPMADFTAYTGLPLSYITQPITTAINKGLLREIPGHWQITPLGARYLNDLLTLFI
ncbi:radical SAM family heme chaperone HemW [Alishewanella sp. 16-MA]|uniref:Heme chaperone HemW n=1 Tax=Alishewanella maricola TaxID=2795740 RepID=A0ABS8C0D5_9ALTE|nr:MULTISPECIES: radical SAM family heme chaperone HemW [Alishewanella]MCB5225775.1 radical SAM family heme chaperone HemW [Alishewanella maricola]MDP4945226.1 radical SAM family heme chaperone HemW [Alishewanella sp.]MDP5187654.1 radical SAM family heme chaperone HemW [Alishewanella sp.]MDP5458301.1 radical SAM family heme chaperone HemW [Alishewanella sp. SMS8]